MSGRLGTRNGTGRSRAWCAVALGLFDVLFDAFALNLALSSIGRDLGASTGDVRWVVSGYLLAVGCLMLPAGRAGDAYGHRRLLVLGLAGFGLASIACAVAPTLPALVVARVLQGAGGASIAPVGLALLTTAFPPERRGRVIGGAVGAGSVAMVAGPFLGGALTQGLGWRAVFCVNAVLTVPALWCLRGVTAPRRRARRHRDEGGPPLGLLRLGPYVTLTVAGGVANAATVALLLLAPLALQGERRLSPGVAGTVLVVPAVLMAVSGPIAGRIPARAAVGAMAGCLGTAALALLFLAVPTALPAHLAALTAAAAALGTANALTLTATQAIVPSDRAGSASGLTKSVVTLCGGLGAVVVDPGDDLGWSWVALWCGVAAAALGAALAIPRVALALLSRGGAANW
ncbi:MAG TPA: MFS transporter [Actinopolymorphaceae bacterium]